jgi:hypothetical protein
MDEAPESAGSSRLGETSDSELQRLNFIRHFGDYAWHLYYRLRSITRELGKNLPGSAAQFSDDLLNEGRNFLPINSWKSVQTTIGTIGRTFALRWGLGHTHLC